MAWFVNWDYNFDLSKGGIELSFRRPNEMASLLVENEAIRRISKIVDDITSTQLSSRYHLIGARGLGKSTILNHIAYGLFTTISKKEAAPIYVSLLGEAMNEQELAVIFFRSCLEGILDLSTDIPRFVLDGSFEETINRLKQARVEYKNQVKEFGKVSLEYVYTAFENQLNHLSHEFLTIVFLIDGLDKQKADAVLGFFRNTQERFNTLITKFNCIFIDAADPSWRETLETNEFSGIRGVSVALRGWTFDEVELLIKKRLQSLGIFKIPFEKETVQVLVEDFHGNPREILQYSTSLLHYAAKQRIKSINPRIARTIVWSEDAKQKFLDAIVSEPELQFAYQKLRGIFGKQQMMNILIATYGTGNQRLYVNLPYEKRSSLGITLSDLDFERSLQILINRGCLRRSKIPNHVELAEDMRKLLGLVAFLKQPMVTLPVVLSELDSKIKQLVPISKESVSLKKEIETTFQQNSRMWLKYKDVKKILLENPKRKIMLEDHFGEDYVKKISNSIPLIVNQLRQQGNLMKDEETGEFRWRPKLIDSETADVLPYKDLLDEIELAKELASTSRLDEGIKQCLKIFNLALSRLDDIFQKKLSNEPLHGVEQFFRVLGVNLEKPVPLKIFSEILNTSPSTKEEVELAINATKVYIRRIMKIYKEFTNYEKDASQKLGNIRKCIVGKSKQKERDNFNKIFLPLLLQKFGRLIDLIDKVKVKDGYISSVPKGFHSLVDEEVLLRSKLFVCPKCNKKSPIASTGEVKSVSCPIDKIPMTYDKDVFKLSDEAYETWNVWVEEYTRFSLENAPCKFVSSGVCLKPFEVTGVSRSYEIDNVVIYKDLSIAVECMENVSCAQERNDVLDAVARIQTLDLFDALILIFRNVDNLDIFTSTIKHHRRLVYPVLVQSPNKFKNTLLQTLSKIKESEQK